MARLFDDGSSQYLEVDSTPISAGFPLTIACWFYSDDPDTEQTFVWIGDKDVENNYVALGHRGHAVGDPIQAVSRNATWYGALSTSGYSINTWHHACGVWSAANARAAFIDGGSKGTDSNSSSPDDQDRTSIGRHGDSSPAGYMSGRLAEVGVWNIALVDAEVDILAARFSPLFVRPQNIVAYWRGVRDDLDIVGGFNLSPVNAPTIAAHCPIIYPAPALFVPSPALVAARRIFVVA